MVAVQMIVQEVGHQLVSDIVVDFHMGSMDIGQFGLHQGVLRGCNGALQAFDSGCLCYSAKHCSRNGGFIEL